MAARPEGEPDPSPPAARTEFPDPRATRLLYTLLGVAVAVSVIHYVDNYFNYDDYPLPGPDSAIPAPSAPVVGFSWFLFTALAVVSVLLWRRGKIVPAAFALIGYSFSGLVGLGHYLVPGATGMVWWRQAHVIADILCGFALVIVALWAARNAAAAETTTPRDDTTT